MTKSDESCHAANRDRARYCRVYSARQLSRPSAWPPAPGAPATLLLQARCPARRFAAPMGALLVMHKVARRRTLRSVNTSGVQACARVPVHVGTLCFLVALLGHSFGAWAFSISSRDSPTGRQDIVRAPAPKPEDLPWRVDPPAHGTSARHSVVLNDMVSADLGLTSRRSQTGGRATALATYHRTTHLEKIVALEAGCEVHHGNVWRAVKDVKPKAGLGAALVSCIELGGLV